MANHQNIIFLDGQFLPASEKLLSSLTPGIMKGRGVFETMRVYPFKIRQAWNYKIPQINDHFSRLSQGLKKLHLPARFSKKQTIQVISELLKLNRLKSARARVVVWKDKGVLRQSVVVFAYHPISQKEYLKGFQATIHPNPLPHTTNSGIKSIDYGFFLKAFERAKAKGFDEALIFNGEGELVEASRSNIFFLKENVLYTPDLLCGGLAGVTRGIVLKLARRMGFKPKAVRAGPEDVLTAQEVFLTNSMIEIMPLTRIDGCLISGGKAGRVTLKLLSAYRSLVEKSLWVRDGSSIK